MWQEDARAGRCEGATPCICRVAFSAEVADVGISPSHHAQVLGRSACVQEPIPSTIIRSLLGRFVSGRAEPVD